MVLLGFYEASSTSARNRPHAAIFSAPLSAFLPGAPVEIVEDERDGFHLRYGGFRIGSHHVWGATAMMLGRFGAFLGSPTKP